MLLLNSKALSPELMVYLNSQQAQITGDPKAKSQAAIAAWGRKNRTRFDSIKQVLLAMSVGVEICVYCENNEATDVEHIFPKRIFPERAFTWDNYVLACGKCNSHHKSDKFKVFNPTGSANVFDVTPKRGSYAKPPNDDALFINQRIEDPLTFIELDLENQTFLFTERATPGTREHEKAKFTIELLALNKRGALVAARKRAAKSYIYMMGLYVDVKAATTFDELDEAIDDFESLDRSRPFHVEKQRILESVKNRTLESDHPSVFRELLRQFPKLKRTKTLLGHAPEILGW